jgi:hypothetical protein
MLVMSLLVLGIGFMQDVVDLLADVLNPFNKSNYLINLSLSMGRFSLCGCNGKSYINWGHWLESQAHLKMVVASRDIKGWIVAMMNTRKTLIPYVGMLELHTLKIWTIILLTTSV